MSVGGGDFLSTSDVAEALGCGGALQGCWMLREPMTSTTANNRAQQQLDTPF